MTFVCPVGPPPQSEGSWIARFYTWVCQVWFPKQRALGDGLDHNSDDEVEVAAGGISTAMIADDAVTFAKMQNVSSERLIGRGSAGSGDMGEVRLAAGGSLSWASTTSIQRAALTGDVTASADDNATTIANDAVTYAKMQNVSATDRVLGRVSAGAGNAEEITFTDQAQSLCDDTSFAAMLVTLGIPAGTTKGDILVWSGSAWAIHPIGADGTSLRANSAATNGIEWT